MMTDAPEFRVSSLWRYPVKSMAGEELETVEVTDRGLNGDRAYALVDASTHKVGSAKNVKRFGDLLKCRAEFLTPPQDGAALPPVRITLPDGRELLSSRPDIDAQLALDFGSGIALVAGAPEGLMLEFAAGTLGGKHSATTQLPVSSGAAPGTLFNYASVHLVTRRTLRVLGLELQRFRPNIVIDGNDEAEFPENDWVGRTLAIGTDVLLRVTIPCPRCVVPTLPRTDLPLDSGILKTVADLNTVNLGDFGDLPCVGVYADVIRPGRIGRGDGVRVVESFQKAVFRY